MHCLFELASAGVDGVGVHVRVHAINAAFSPVAGGLRARPLLYGLILFTRTLGRDPRLLPVQVRSSGALQLKAWAVRVLPDAIHVLVIDKGRRAVRVALRLPMSGPGTIQRLLAPSVRARSGVTLAGQRLNAEGHWRGPDRTQKVAPGPRGYELDLPARSAALVVVERRG